MREFTTAARQAPEQGVVGTEITTKIDGREITFLAPTESQLALLISADVQGIGNKISAAINFFFSSIRDVRDVEYFKSRMWDRADDFGAEQVVEIIEALVEEWTGGNPTQPSSESTPSPESTGVGSTGTQPSGV